MDFEDFPLYFLAHLAVFVGLVNDIHMETSGIFHPVPASSGSRDRLPCPKVLGLSQRKRTRGSDSGVSPWSNPWEIRETDPEKIRALGSVHIDMNISMNINR